MSKPLIVSRDTQLGTIPAFPMPGQRRERRPLYVGQRTIHMETPFGWIRIPASYVTDFASIPWLATVASGTDLQALGRWAPAALGHDWFYAVGEPGSRWMADEFFRWRMKIDGVPGYQRDVLYRAVRIGGGGGFKRAPSWWDTENFADPDTGAYPIKPPFAREEAFAGQAWGRRLLPNWS